VAAHRDGLDGMLVKPIEPDALTPLSHGTRAVRRPNDVAMRLVCGLTECRRLASRDLLARLAGRGGLRNRVLSPVFNDRRMPRGRVT
jgi:hypothetical protein